MTLSNWSGLFLDAAFGGLHPVYVCSQVLWPFGEHGQDSGEDNHPQCVQRWVTHHQYLSSPSRLAPVRFQASVSFLVTCCYVIVCQFSTAVVDNPRMQTFIREKTAVPYFSNLVWYMGKHILELESCVRNDVEYVFSWESYYSFYGYAALSSDSQFCCTGHMFAVAYDIWRDTYLLFAVTRVVTG